MREITINTSKVIGLATLLGSLGVIYTFSMNVLGTVATRSDIVELTKKVDLGFLDINIDRNNVDLRRYDDLTKLGTVLSDGQQRKYNSLIESNKRLLLRREGLLK